MKLDGTDIKEVEENRKKYISVPNDEKLLNRLGTYLLRSQDEEMEITVLRDEKEQTYTVKGTTQYKYFARTIENFGWNYRAYQSRCAAEGEYWNGGSTDHERSSGYRWTDR